MTLDEIHPVYRSTERVTQKQLDAVERELGAPLPKGYREFLRRLGHGWINDWLQIYCPGPELLREQRQSLAQRFIDHSRDYGLKSKLTEADIATSVQLGIDQDTLQLFACRRFPGSVFAWSGLTIKEYKTGVEDLAPFAGMRMEQFAYFLPLEPKPESRSLACQSKKLEVKEVVNTINDLCYGRVRMVDVDEGPGAGSRTPAYWLFPEKLGAKLHIYCVETAQHRRVYLTLVTSPVLLPKVEALIEKMPVQLGVKFKPARWH